MVFPRRGDERYRSVRSRWSCATAKPAHLNLTQSKRGHRMFVRCLAATLFALQLALGTGFGTAGWTVPRHLPRAWLVPGGRYRHAWETLDDRGLCLHHAVVSAVKRRRARTAAMMSATATGAADSGSGDSGGDGRAQEEGQGVRTPEAAGENDGDDHYSVLGLAVGASSSQIKDAYRRLAMELHPDSERADRDKFEIVKEAYEVLSDPGRRSTYDQGLAMRSFVDKVKAGNWRKTLMAVANLGAVATSVGVSVGVAAAEPLAKDLARGIEDFTLKGMQTGASASETDPLAREQQAVMRAKKEAERKLKAFERKAAEAAAEAAGVEKRRDLRVKERDQWNSTLASYQQDVVTAQQLLADSEAEVSRASAVVSEHRLKEQEATESFRKSRGSRELYAQASTAARRKVSLAETSVAGAEQRVEEALKALDMAREVLASVSQQADDLQAQQSQVYSKQEAAEEALVQAKELTLVGRRHLSECQTSQAAVQATIREKSKREGIAAARVKKIDDMVRKSSIRAKRLRAVAAEAGEAAKAEGEAIALATQAEARLKAQAAASEAAREAAAAAAQEEILQRERQEAADAAAAAVARAKEAEDAAVRAAEAAVAAAAAARQATVDALAAAGEKQQAAAVEAEPSTASSSDSRQREVPTSSDGICDSDIISATPGRIDAIGAAASIADAATGEIGAADHAGQGGAEAVRPAAGDSTHVSSLRIEKMDKAPKPIQDGSPLVPDEKHSNT